MTKKIGEIKVINPVFFVNQSCNNRSRLIKGKYFFIYRTKKSILTELSNELR